jgi:hypothetical protein
MLNRTSSTNILPAMKSTVSQPTAALRAAPTGFSARIKNIRTENPVTDNGTDGLAFPYEIVDCARMAFSSVHDRRSARTAFRPRNNTGNQILFG